MHVDHSLTTATTKHRDGDNLNVPSLDPSPTINYLPYLTLSIVWPWPVPAPSSREIVNHDNNDLTNTNPATPLHRHDRQYKENR